MIIKFFLWLIFSLPLFASSQGNEYDLIHEVGDTTKTKIIYLTAVWCKPCMDKLPSIINEFGSKEGYELQIVLDRYGLSDKIFYKVKELYDTTLLHLLTSKYYLKQSKGGVKINPSKKIIKALISDLNNNCKLNLSFDDLWFGNAIISSRKGVYITRQFGKTEIIAEIKSVIKKL